MKKWLLVSLLFIAACINSPNDEITEGKELAKQYCGSCHVVPAPDLLDKTSWEKYMLPRMGYFLGVIEHDSIRSVLITNEIEQQIVDAHSIFPKRRLVTDGEWKKIKAYFIKNAPDKPLPQAPRIISKGLKGFKVIVPMHRMSPPSATLVKFNADQTIYLGDANTQTLSVFANDLSLIQAAMVKEGAVSAQEFDDKLLLTVMGSFSPTDIYSGFILSLPKTPSGKVGKIIDSLQRPVHAAYGDLDNDGRIDVVTCEFAKWTGNLSWWKNDANGHYNRHILRNKPGAIKTYITDMNKDSYPDIVALMSQGDEGIFLYTNDGKGRFKEETLLHFPPSYGSSYFNLYDFNEDGHQDIIYTAGDNADFPAILKNYHGVYIYINDGHNNFYKQSFFPLNGAYAAIPNDYDLDGDIDIAAISFFPDYANQPEESFVMLTNDGSNNYAVSSLEDPTLGRWIVMDAADYDSDGDTDIILGSLAFETIPDNGLVQKWVKRGVPFIILQNQTR